RNDKEEVEMTKMAVIQSSLFSFFPAIPVDKLPGLSYTAREKQKTNKGMAHGKNHYKSLRG
ncbi:MAG TPA: hypothetical protein PK953_10985, partial [Smithellaceae bacterium]|nr:hypothetical protein [Smithellaceae bacterium]HPY08216.1 hypothetical protein [Smithellaceae bacterium]HQC11424.1 hypothetical protein [Smithellaceae bacterium]